MPGSQEFELGARPSRQLKLDLDVVIDRARSVFVALMRNADVSVHTTLTRVNGLLSVRHARPTAHPNAWAAALDDDAPSTTVRWPSPQRISRVELAFDTDLDHPMETVL